MLFRNYCLRYKVVDDLAQELKALLRQLFSKGDTDFFVNEFAFEVDKPYIYVRMGDVYPNEVARTLIKSVDIRAAASRSFELPKVHNDTVINQFAYQLSNRRYAEIELLTKVGKGVITVIDIITDNVFLKRGTADAHSYFF